MTKEQIQQQIESLQKQLAELEAAPKEWPQVGDDLFVLAGNGDIHEYSFTSADFFSGEFAQGNAFRTRKEAEAERDARAVVAELRKQPGRKKFVVGETNYSLSVSLGDDNVDWWQWDSKESGWSHTYFDSKESVLAAIKAVGADRILKAARWWACGEY